MGLTLAISLQYELLNTFCKSAAQHSLSSRRLLQLLLMMIYLYRQRVSVR